ncbi:glutamine--fructose-6-phosphate transaminase (isomerizing) [Candidatus Woesebacteria bacterium]|nr:glutamine--fructose-6-phosphate transaminase (isomerizing) [Candidatus Woesebacteria bacterium]
MCGIFAYSGSQEEAAQIVFTGLKSLEYRGYDSWGIAIAHNGKISVKKQVGKMKDGNVDTVAQSHVALGHTRWATHGGVCKKNAHPHVSCDGRIAVVHNGIVENFIELKKQLEITGHHFKSETDSEVIVHLFEELRSTHSITEAFKKTCAALRGSNAIVLFDAVSNSLLALKNGSPLIIGRNAEELFLASDPAALQPYATEISYVDDDCLVVWMNEQLSFFDTHTDRQLHPTFQTISLQKRNENSNLFTHFMAKEIHEQPQLLRSLAESGSSDFLELKEIARCLLKAKRRYIVGCGSSYYLAQIAHYLFAQTGVQATSYMGSEFLEAVPTLNNQDFVLIISQSGETMDCIIPLKTAVKNNAKVGALLNVQESTVYRLATYPALINAGQEQAVATTKAFSCTLARLYILAHFLTRKELELSVFSKAADSIEKVLSVENSTLFQEVVRFLKKKQHIFCLGRGISYPLALEAALKIKEVSYIHAEGFAGGELKHGPLALLSKGTACIVFAPNDQTYNAAISNAIEMKSRGGIIIGVSPQRHQVFDYFIPVDDLGMLTLFPMLAVGQYLGYLLAVENGRDPDMPRNLAKSVTVI